VPLLKGGDCSSRCEWKQPHLKSVSQRQGHGLRLDRHYRIVEDCYPLGAPDSHQNLAPVEAYRNTSPAAVLGGGLSDGTGISIVQ